MDVTAKCVRASKDFWAVSVPEVKGAYTQAADLDEVPAAVAEVVFLLTGTSESEVRVTVEEES